MPKQMIELDEAYLTRAVSDYLLKTKTVEDMSMLNIRFSYNQVTRKFGAFVEVLRSGPPKEKEESKTNEL